MVPKLFVGGNCKQLALLLCLTLLLFAFFCSSIILTLAVTSRHQEINSSVLSPWFELGAINAMQPIVKRDTYKGM